MENIIGPVLQVQVFSYIPGKQAYHRASFKHFIIQLYIYMFKSSKGRNHVILVLEGTISGTKWQVISQAVKQEMH